MGLSVTENISALAVFFQGLLSFFSPCVLPLIPIYMGYLAGGIKEEDFGKNRFKIFINTLCFIIGISFAFFLLGLGFTAFGQFFMKYKNIITIIGAVAIFLFGLYSIGVFGFNAKLAKERRIDFRLDKLAMNPLVAIVFGFTFSFAWTPCVGPMLASVLIMVGSKGTMVEGLVLIGVYTLGFVIPFMLLGLFTGKVLEVFNSHRGILKYSTKIGGLIMIIMSLVMIGSLFENNMTVDIPKDTMTEVLKQDKEEVEEKVEETVEENIVYAPDIELKDQNGNTHKLSDYRGKVVLLNFWATWCGPCRSELQHIQELYEEYGYNKEDVVILGLANPNGADGTEEEIKEFIDSYDLEYPTLMDTTGQYFSTYWIQSFPTTFMISKEGSIFGYIPGALQKEQFKDIINQTITGVAR